MPVDEKLLDILCCPATRVPVKMLADEKVKQLNELIGRGGVAYESGEKVSAAVDEALITEDGKKIYEVRKGIPIMLIDRSIPTRQLEGF